MGLAAALPPPCALSWWRCQTVRLWDLRSRSQDPIQVLTGCFKDSVTSVVCTSHAVVTGCVDGSVRTHDLRAGLCHGEWEG